jgi:sortase (surface protein transpeptidase)
MMLKKIDVRTFLSGQKSMVSRRKKKVACSVLCVLLLLCLYGSSQAVGYRMGQHPIANVGPASASSMAGSMDRPTRLIIPAIHLDAAVEMVGLKADGDLDTPGEYPLDDVGWYKMGPVPGARGSAVIDGHLDRPGGSPAVFWYLHRLQARDDVTVFTSRGKTLHFHVTHVQAYQTQNAPLQAIFGDMSGNYLNLITCAGDWIPTEHQTTQRLVVYTSLVNP